MKKFTVTFLLDKKNDWISKFINFRSFKSNEKYSFKVQTKTNFIKNQDIVFPINFTKILPISFLKKNKLTLIVHSSDLPRNKGFAPMSYQILRRKNYLLFSLIKASERVDSGDICFKTKIKLDGTELYEELRKKQALEINRIIKKFLTIYPKVTFKKQKGRGSYNKKRGIIDSKIDIEKSVKSQFNLLRVCDNENFPSYFYYKKKKYILKIFKERK